MYRCQNCGVPFDEPVEYRGTTVCPICGIDDYEEARECAECGIWLEEYKLHGGLCPDCEKKMRRRISQALDAFKAAVGETGLAYIRDEMEGYIDVL